MSTSDSAGLGRHRSVWLATAPQTGFPPLQGRVSADVAVIGGGITGLTTALLLRRAGSKVAVIEAGRVGCGVTGSSTAKLTSLHKAIYAGLEQSFDREAARLYAQANEGALAKVAELAAEFGAAGADCAFERLPACTYTRDPKLADHLRAEAEAARRAGLAASYVERLDLPFDIVGAVSVENQAQFDPYRYCRALAEACAREGVEIFESTRIGQVARDGDAMDCETVTKDASLRASHVVVATLLPFLDRGGFFARAFPSRSYGIAVTLDGEAPRSMSINLESPTRSLRRLPDGRGIILVGEEHKVGQNRNTLERYAALEAWAREHFRVRSIDARWSAQDYMAADGLPYVGRMPGGAGRIWTATGFSKWGLTNGTAAAMVLRDLIHEKENPWAGLFDAGRLDLVPSAKQLVKENADVAARFVGDRLRALTVPDIEALPPGQGAIVRAAGHRVAAYRDEAGNVHARSPLCTHMGCYVQWNAAEKSWDCPCHGSRFDHHGEVLQGPAVRGLGPAGTE